MAVIVISYSRADRPIVHGLVALLRTGLRGLRKAVFWDEDFTPGEEWFQQIAVQIDKADQLFVFWCRHSARSRQVQREVNYALRKKRRVVPVLLDSSALMKRLTKIHAIDLRGFEHGAVGRPKKRVVLKASRKGRAFGKKRTEFFDLFIDSPSFDEGMKPSVRKEDVLEQFKRHLPGTTLKRHLVFQIERPTVGG
jgi:hypothetical protein